MKFKVTLSILLLAALTACKKTTNVDVSLSTSGKLTYRLLDDAGKGLPNVKVSLYDNPDYNQVNKILLDELTTDQNGQVDFGDLNPKTYLVIPDSPMVNKIQYNIQDYIQVLTGKTKNKEIKVSDFSGTIKLKIYNYNLNRVQANVGVLLIPGQKFYYQQTVPYYINLADYKGTTDANGEISFKVPSDKGYIVYVYDVTTNKVYASGGYVAVQKDQVYSQTFSIYEY
jgi:hypothetical protein